MIKLFLTLAAFAGIEDVHLEGDGNLSASGDSGENHIWGNGGSNLLTGGGANDHAPEAITRLQSATCHRNHQGVVA